MLLLLTAAFLLKRYGTQAVPLPAPTPASSTFEAHIFARDDSSDECHGRTVLDILWSCIATTFACTWVSVHPNVPFKGEGKWTLLGRRIFLMFFSILAPEFVIMWAFKQWRGAVMIREGVNKALKNASPTTVKPLWTTAHGHFLQMGGFRLLTTARETLYDNVSGTHRRRPYALIPVSLIIGPRKRETITGLISQEIYEHAHREWPAEITADASRPGFGNGFREGVLTYDAFQKLLAEDLIRFPTITEDEINDRSKGDALSKGIALLQLTWFIVQIITRHAQDLAITELELTTAALAGLNSVMYIFWWSKPRDVRFPVVIRTKGVEELLATKAKDTKWSFSEQEFDFRKHLLMSMSTPIDEVFSALRRFLVSSPKMIKTVLPKFASDVMVLARHFHSSLTQLYRYFLGIIGERKSVMPKHTSEKESSAVPAVAHPEPNSANENMSRIQKICVSGAKTAVYCFAFLFSLPVYVINLVLCMPISLILADDGNNGYHIPMVFDEDEQATVFFMMFYSEDAEINPLLITASLAGALFGGVHCLAWHFRFPSHAEQIMWRTASLGIVGACALSFVGTYLWNTDFYSTDITEVDEIPLVLDYVFLAILQFILMFLTAVVYPVFRLMLLVLAVTSLRSLPPSAFDTDLWVEFVPHI